MTAKGTREGHRAFRLYISAQYVYFTAASMQGVLFAWIVTQALRAPESVVGFAQMLALLPLLLIPFGGAAADGRALKPYLSRAQLLMTIPALAIATAAAAGWLSLPAAIAYAFMSQMIAAFVTPARDAALTLIVPPGGTVPQTVANATGAAFAGQMTGFALASLADSWGLVLLTCLQVGLYAASAMLTAQMPVHEPLQAQHPRRTVRQTIKGIGEGFTVLWADERLRAITIFVSLASLAMNSLWLVVLPLIVRDIHHGTSAQLAGLFMAFMGGTTLSAMTISRLKPMKRPGRLMLLANLNSIAVFIGVYFNPPYWLLVLLILAWGIGAGTGMVMSRSIVQDSASPAYRARLLSLFQFAQMIGGVPGSLIVGLLAQGMGILNTVLVLVVWISLLWLAMFRFSPIWSLTHLDQPAEDPRSMPPPLPVMGVESAEPNTSEAPSPNVTPSQPRP